MVNNENAKLVKFILLLNYLLLVLVFRFSKCCHVNKTIFREIFYFPFVTFYRQMPSGATQKQLLQWIQLVKMQDCMAMASLKNVSYKKYVLSKLLILRFRNKNIEILLQLSGKCLTTCLIHNFSFTIHNYRLCALQIQS